MADTTDTVMTTAEEELAGIRGILERSEKRYPNATHSSVKAMSEGEFRHAVVTRLTIIALCVGITFMTSALGAFYVGKQYYDAKQAIDDAQNADDGL